MGFIKDILLKLLSPMGYRGVINTQISVYKRLKKRAPEMSENDLLNRLIISRIEALPRVASKEEEYAHYTTLLENPDKTLEDVIWVIVEYEFIQSREEKLLVQGHKMGLSQREWSLKIERFRVQVKKDIEESISKKVENSGDRDTKEPYKKIWYEMLSKS